MKRGDMLTDNFLEIVLAIIGLVLVGYVAYQIYQISVHQDVTIAKKMLDSLEAKINRLEVGQTGEYTLRTPYKKDKSEYWFLTGWGKQDTDRPEKCYFQSCICACNGKGTTLSTRTATCQTNGYCRFFADSSVTFTTLLKDFRIAPRGGDATLARTFSEDTKQTDSVAPGISFTEGLVLVTIEKKEEGLVLTSK